MKSRFSGLLVFAVLMLGVSPLVMAQRQSTQSELSIAQRLDVMTRKLETMRRSLSSALSSMAPAEKPIEKAKQPQQSADDPVVRLRGLEKEVTSRTSEVNDLRTKNDKAEKFDSTAVDRGCIKRISIE